MLRRLLLPIAAATLLFACSSKEEAVRLATGCDGQDGTCTRYVQTLDNEGAPLDRSSLMVPFTQPIKLSERPPDLFVVTAARDVRAELAGALVAAGTPPLHLRRRGDELDEIYRRYFAAH